MGMNILLTGLAAIMANQVFGGSVLISQAGAIAMIVGSVLLWIHK